jgi:hypothetical protein
MLWFGAALTVCALGAVGLALKVAFERNAKEAAQAKADDEAKLAAKRTGDEVLSKELVGAWAGTADLENGVKVSFTQTYFSDGTSAIAGKITFQGKDLDVNFKTKWRIDGKRIYEVITESSHPNLLPVGKSDSDEIVNLTDTLLVTRDKDGHTETKDRIDK